MFFQLILHSEQELLAHAETLLNTFSSTISDSEDEVGKYVGQCAFLFGHFVPARSWSPLVLARLQQRLTSGGLREELLVLSKVMAGSEPASLRPALEDIMLVLQDDNACLVYDVSAQNLVFCQGP